MQTEDDQSQSVLTQKPANYYPQQKTSKLQRSQQKTSEHYSSQQKTNEHYSSLVLKQI